MSKTYYPVYKSSSGDVGVGTTSPTLQSNYRFLQVNGSVSAVIEATVGGTRIGGFDSTSSVLYVGTIGSYPVVFRTAVDEKMRISANGNVGIGTTNANRKLTVYGDGTLLSLQSPSANQYSEIEFTANGVGAAYIFKSSAGYTNYGGAGAFNIYNAGPIAFHSSSNNNTVYIQADGNVGIGTTSPAYTLQVGTGANSATARAAFLGGYTVFENSAGTGNPSITFNNDTDTGILNPASNTIVFTTNGTEKIRINSDGNLGIGTTSPTQKLDVRGYVLSDVNSNGVESGFYLGNSGHGIRRAAATNDVYVYTTSGSVYLGTGGSSSQQLTINSNGNLGIGTTSPSTKLEVIGDIAAFANGADTITRGVYIANAANTKAFNFQLNSGGTNLDLWSYNSAGAWVRRVSFNYDGNVGIGTTAPSSTLYVTGNVGISGNITKGGGSFLIEHPDPEKQGWKLQHSFVESPTVGDNIYRYEVTINETLQGSIELPDYWKHLNENPQIWISPVKHFGIAYGEINEEVSSLTVFANSAGKYNVLLIGTRKDPTIKKIMADFAVERKPE